MDHTLCFQVPSNQLLLKCLRSCLVSAAIFDRSVRHRAVGGCGNFRYDEVLYSAVRMQFSTFFVFFLLFFKFYRRCVEQVLCYCAVHAKTHLLLPHACNKHLACAQQRQHVYNTYPGNFQTFGVRGKVKPFL
jgi:hypothetical protein